MAPGSQLPSGNANPGLGNAHRHNTSAKTSANTIEMLESTHSADLLWLENPGIDPRR
jgi:hypothetical protein